MPGQVPVRAQETFQYPVRQRVPLRKRSSKAIEWESKVKERHQRRLTLWRKKITKVSELHHLLPSHVSQQFGTRGRQEHHQITAWNQTGGPSMLTQQKQSVMSMHVIIHYLHERYFYSVRFSDLHSMAPCTVSVLFSHDEFNIRIWIGPAFCMFRDCAPVDTEMHGGRGGLHGVDWTAVGQLVSPGQTHTEGRVWSSCNDTLVLRSQHKDHSSSTC